MFSLSDVCHWILYDPEWAEYRVKQILSEKESAFRDEKLFPHLEQLHSLDSNLNSVLQGHRQLDSILQPHSESRIRPPGVGAVTKSQESMVEKFLRDMSADVWALIQFGESIREAAKRCLRVDLVAGISQGVKEGCFVLHADSYSGNQESVHQLFAYDLGLQTAYSDGESRYQLDAVHIHPLPTVDVYSPNKIREKLLQTGSLTQEETLLVVRPETDRPKPIDLPYKPTQLPVAQGLVRQSVERMGIKR